ncbi:MAG: GFA family protein [Burkholderiales bacterium]
MKVDGGCHCGKITYEAEINPEKVSICHCTDCQTGSGSGYRTNVQTERNTFKLLTGEPRIYIKTAESGNKRAQGFCADCGTPLFSTTETNREVYGLRVGSIRQRSELRPRSQGWYRSAQPWTQDISELPQHPKQRPAA